MIKIMGQQLADELIAALILAFESSEMNSRNLDGDT